jgi:hypothetical protein
MSESEKPQSKLVEAQRQVAEAKRVLGATTPLLIDRLLVATNGNKDLVEGLMQDVASTAGQAGTLAVALRRENAAKYETEHRELHPDTMSARQESGLFGNDGAQPIIEALKTIDTRAELVAKGQSPVQQTPKRAVA